MEPERGNRVQVMLHFVYKMQFCVVIKISYSSMLKHALHPDWADWNPRLLISWVLLNLAGPLHAHLTGHL